VTAAQEANVGTADLPCKIEKGEDGKTAKVTLWRPYGDEFRVETDYAYVANIFKRPITEVQFECAGPIRHKGVKGKHLIGVPK